MLFRIVVPALFCLTCVGIRTASACSPPLPPTPSVDQTTPENGETHPANAGVLLRGVLLGDTVSGTIDGEPVEVEIDTALSQLRKYEVGYAYNEMVLRTIPQPEPGQVVHLFGDPCVEGECVLDLEFVAGELDLTPPEAPSIYTDFYDHGAVAVSTESCQQTATGRYRFVVYAENVESHDGEATLHELGIVHGDTTVTGSSRWSSISSRSRDWEDDPGYLEDLCGAARVTDLAGNRSDFVLSCTPCHSQVHNGEPLCSNSSCYPHISPQFTCDSIINREACQPSVLEQCPEGTTDGEATDSEGEPDESSTGETSGMDSDDFDDSEGSETAGTSGNPMDAGFGDDQGCTCNSAETPDLSALLLLLLVAFRRPRRQLR